MKLTVENITAKKLEAMKPGTVFASWIIKWEYIDGFAEYDLRKDLRYECKRVAVRGNFQYHDWTVYIQPPFSKMNQPHFASMNHNFKHKHTIRTEDITKNIWNKISKEFAVILLSDVWKKLDKEALKLYRI